MESRSKILGHPMHPMLITLPLGLFVTAVIFDILFLITGNDLFPTVSFYAILTGLIGGLLAAIFGFIDWFAIPAGTRAKRVGLLHAGGNIVLLILFSFSWLIRRSEPGLEPPPLSLLASFLAIAIGMATAWLGGELVYRLGVGVDPGANLEAPNSLSDQPASPSSRMTSVPVTGSEKEIDEP